MVTCSLMEFAHSLSGMNDAPMTQNTADEEFRTLLARLKEEHRDLDAAIAALHQAPVLDRLQIQRLKKRKLALKDQIGSIECSLIPDIIA